MAKAGVGGMTALRVREVHAFLGAAGYASVPGKHKHLKLRHPDRPPVLLPLQPEACHKACPTEDRPDMMRGYEIPEQKFGFLWSVSR